MKHNKVLQCGLTIDELVQKALNSQHTNNQLVKNRSVSVELTPIRTDAVPLDVVCRFEREPVVDYAKLRTAHLLEHKKRYNVNY